jgi:hypothetical protein
MKKQTLLLSLLVVLSLSAKAQLKEFLRGQDVYWSGWIQENRYTNALDEIWRSPVMQEYEIPSKTNLRKAHFVDFDADGKKDIIVMGNLGGESESILFFRNNGIDYEETLSILGEMVYVSDYKMGQPLSFAINHYGCCEDNTDNFEYYVPVGHGDDFHFELSQKISHLKSGTFPKEFISPIGFYTTQEKYTLRMDPSIPEETGDFADYSQIAAIYPPMSEGVAIAKKKDATGRLWYFVIMENNQAPLEEWVHKGFNSPAPHRTMGWMSSRFLEVYE